MVRCSMRRWQVGHGSGTGWLLAVDPGFNQGFETEHRVEESVKKTCLCGQEVESCLHSDRIGGTPLSPAH